MSVLIDYSNPPELFDFDIPICVKRVWSNKQFNDRGQSLGGEEFSAKIAILWKHVTAIEEAIGMPQFTENLNPKCFIYTHFNQTPYLVEVDFDTLFKYWVYYRKHVYDGL